MWMTDCTHQRSHTPRNKKTENHHLQKCPLLGSWTWYCWWFRNPANHLRLVVYPIIYMVFSTIQLVVADGISGCHQFLVPWFRASLLSLWSLKRLSIDATGRPSSLFFSQMVPFQGKHVDFQGCCLLGFVFFVSLSCGQKNHLSYSFRNTPRTSKYCLGNALTRKRTARTWKTPARKRKSSSKP